jgi:hypothetical protein
MRVGVQLLATSLPIASNKVNSIWQWRVMGLLAGVRAGSSSSTHCSPGSLSVLVVLCCR